LTLRGNQQRFIGSLASSMITIPTEVPRPVEKTRLREFLTSTFHKSTPDGAERHVPIYRMASFKCIRRSLQKTRKLEPMVTQVQ